MSQRPASSQFPRLVGHENGTRYNRGRLFSLLVNESSPSPESLIQAIETAARDTGWNPYGAAIVSQVHPRTPDVYSMSILLTEKGEATPHRFREPVTMISIEARENPLRKKEELRVLVVTHDNVNDEDARAAIADAVTEAGWNPDGPFESALPEPYGIGTRLLDLRYRESAPAVGASPEI